MISVNKGFSHSLYLQCYHLLHDYLKRMHNHYGEDQETCDIAIYWMMESMILVLASAFTDLNESKGTHIVVDPCKVKQHFTSKCREIYEDALQIFPKEV